MVIIFRQVGRVLISCSYRQERLDSARKLPENIARTTEVVSVQDHEYFSAR